MTALGGGIGSQGPYLPYKRRSRPRKEKREGVSLFGRKVKRKVEKALTGWKKNLSSIGTIRGSGKKRGFRNVRIKAGGEKGHRLRPSEIEGGRRSQRGGAEGQLKGDYVLGVPTLVRDLGKEVDN